MAKVSMESSEYLELVRGYENYKKVVDSIVNNTTFTEEPANIWDMAKVNLMLPENLVMDVCERLAEKLPEKQIEMANSDERWFYNVLNGAFEYCKTENCCFISQFIK